MLEKHKHIIAFGLILIVISLVYLYPLRRGRVYYSQDTSDFNYVMLRSHVEDLKRHGFRAWCPGVGTGFVRAADPTYTLFSPRVLLFLVISDYRAQIASIVLYAVWAGLGAYALGLAMGAGFFASLFLGLSWPLCGAFASSISNIPYFTSAAWYPWALAAWLGISRFGPRAAASGFAAAMIAIEGDPIIAFLFPGIFFFSSLAASRKEKMVRELACLALCALMLAGVSAVAWIPAFAALPESARAQGLSIYEATAFSLHPARVINLFAARFFGQAHEGSFWALDFNSALSGAGFWFQTIYLGLFALFFAARAAVIARGRRGLAFSFLLPAAVLFWLALGRYGGLLPWLMDNFASLKVFRFPAKFFAPAALLVLAASGLGMADFIDKAKISPKVLKSSALAWLLVFFSLFLVALYLFFLFRPKMGASVSASRPELSVLRARQDLFRLLVFSLLVPAFLLAAAKMKKPQLAPLGLVVLACLDLVSAFPATPAHKVPDLFHPSPVAEEIKRRGQGRLIAFDNPYSYALLRIGPRVSARPNWGVIDGLEYAFGKGETLPAILTQLNNYGVFQEQGEALFRVLAIRYVITPIKPAEKWVRTLAMKGVLVKAREFPKHDLALYRSREAWPLAFITRRAAFAAGRQQALTLALGEGGVKPDEQKVFIALDEVMFRGKKVPGRGFPLPGFKESPAGREAGIISVSRADPEKELFEVELSRPGLLVVREYSRSGWRAYVDGEEVPIYFADGVSRAVLVQEGRHRVEFKFQSAVIRSALAISAFSLLLGVLVLSSFLTWTHKPPPAQGRG